MSDHTAELGLNENDFRIICRNGTLADRTGFDVDEACALTTIIDNEIVVRPKSDKIPGIVNALASFDKYFSHNPDFKMYNIFNGYKHLLFKVMNSFFNIGTNGVNVSILSGLNVRFSFTRRRKFG